jgi:hypothetical protein
MYEESGDSRLNRKYVRDNDCAAISRKFDLDPDVRSILGVGRACRCPANVHALHMTNMAAIGIIQERATKCIIYYS